MSTPARQLSRIAVATSKRPATASSFRLYSDRPYPFTKPSDPGAIKKTPSDQGPKAAYPFTRSSEPAPIATSTRPVERPGPPHDSSEVVSNEEEDGLEVPRPDYNVAEADYRTSSFSPVPMRVQDGSEPMDVAPAAVTSGAPVDLQARTVRYAGLRATHTPSRLETYTANM